MKQKHLSLSKGYQEQTQKPKPLSSYKAFGIFHHTPSLTQNMNPLYVFEEFEKDESFHCVF